MAGAGSPPTAAAAVGEGRQTARPATSASFGAGAERWMGRLGSVRNVVRQELAARNLAEHLPATAPGTVLRVLDAGCGQGTLGRRLALAGHHITGLDVDQRMLDGFRAELAGCTAAVRSRVTLRLGSVEDAPDLLPTASYDVVICHGVLMYLDDPAPAVAALAAMLRPGGVLSLLARNQVGIAMRAGYRGRWAEALAAVSGSASYVNELGVPARADTVTGLHELVTSHGLEPVDWYGVRALSDGVTLGAPEPDDDLDVLLAAEDMAGRTDPYRAVAPLFQLIARRSS